MRLQTSSVAIKTITVRLHKLSDLDEIGLELNENSELLFVVIWINGRYLVNF